MSFLPFGIIGFILAKKEHKKDFQNERGANYVIGFIEITIGIMMILAGILGFFTIIAVVGR
jgi:hypothetical protein